MPRVIKQNPTGQGFREVADAETANLGAIAPLVGNLTLGGAAGSGVIVTPNQTLTCSGLTGGLRLTGGADIVGAAGCGIAGFDSIEGIVPGEIADLSASETVTGQWTFQAISALNPKLIAKAFGGELLSALLFQVQTSTGTNLFSVNGQGNGVFAGAVSVAGLLQATGDVQLGDGANTIRVGYGTSAPIVGDSVVINTMGSGANGTFTLTTANLCITPAGQLDLVGPISFASAGTIDTSGNNDLTINVGSAHLHCTAGLVDLRSAVTALDIPAGVALKIGGTALTTAQFTAANVSTLLSGANADALHAHAPAASTVLPVTTNFNGILSVLDDTAQKALDTIDDRIYTQATAPTGPVDGTMWYCTAAGWKTLLCYDASRSKWLGSEFTLQFGHDSADGELLRGSGVQVAAIGTGVMIPQNALVKRITARTTTDNNLKRIDIYKNGVSVLNFSLVDGTNCSYYTSNTVDLDLVAGDYCWVYCDAAGNAIDNVTVTLWCCWRFV